MQDLVLLRGSVQAVWLLKTWRSQGVTIPFFQRDRLACVHEHFETMSGGDGWIRTTVLLRTDLQSAAIDHSATSPYFYSQAPRDAKI